MLLAAQHASQQLSKVPPGRIYNLKAYHLPVMDALLHAVLPGRTGSDSRIVQLAQTASPSPGVEKVLTGHGRQIKSPYG
jgi:hypothetical protein